MRGWVLLGAALVLGGPAAQAQMDSREAIQLQNQILGMRRDIQALQQGQGSAPARAPRYTGGDADPGAANGLTAQLLDRVSTLEDQVRELRGQVDRLANQQQRQGEDLGKQIADMNFALQQGQGGAPQRPQAAPPSALGGSGLGSPGLAAGPPPGAATPPRTPELAMQEGNAALARRDYPAPG